MEIQALVHNIEIDAANEAARQERIKRHKAEREGADRKHKMHVATLALTATLDKLLEAALAASLVEHGPVTEAFSRWKERNPKAYRRERLERMGAAADRVRYRGVFTFNFVDVRLSDAIVEAAADALKVSTLADAERVA